MVDEHEITGKVTKACKSPILQWVVLGEWIFKLACNL